MKSYEEVVDRFYRDHPTEWTLTEVELVELLRGTGDTVEQITRLNLARRGELLLLGLPVRLVDELPDVEFWAP